MFDPSTFDAAHGVAYGDEAPPPSGPRSTSSLPPSGAGAWRREVGRRMVAFVRAVGGLLTQYESTKRASSPIDTRRAGDACERALDELDRLSVALRQLRRSLHPE